MSERDKKKRLSMYVTVKTAGVFNDLHACSHSLCMFVFFLFSSVLSYF